MSYERYLGRGGPIGYKKRVFGGPVTGHVTNLVQSSYRVYRLEF